MVVIALGCESSGRRRVENRIESTTELREGLTKGSQQIDATLASMDALFATTTGDLRPAYEKFSTQIAALDKEAKTARDRAESMKVSSQEYFEAWRKELEGGFSNPELRKLSGERQEAARQQFDQLRSVAETARQAYQKFSANLHEVQKFLDLELNPDGIKAATPMAGKAKSEGSDVKAKIADLVKELDKTVKALSPTQGGPTPGGTS